MRNNKKKILFASKDLSVGGMEKALVTLLNNTDFSKYDVTLVLESVSGKLLDTLDKRVSLVEYKVSDMKISILRKALNFSRRIAFALRHGKKYDFSCAYATYSIPCGMLARIASDNNALYVHSDYAAKDGNVRATEFFESIGIRSYSKVIFVSEKAKNSCAVLFPDISERFYVNGNLSDITQTEKMSKENSECPDKPKDVSLFIFVGRLDDTSKKLRRLFDAVLLIDKSRYPLEVWVVGDGPDRKLYEDYVKSNGLGEVVTFFGETRNPYPYISKADCVVIVSDYEGFPVVYSEAALLGKSVVTTVPASDGAFFIDISNAYVADKNPESVSRAMKAFMDDKEKMIPRFDFQTINETKIINLYKIMED